MKNFQVLILCVTFFVSEIFSLVQLVPMYDETVLSFKDTRTIWMGEVPGKPKHFWVLGQEGKIFSLYPTAQGNYVQGSKNLLADFSSKTKLVLKSEYGAYGVAFHQNFSENGLFYIIYLAHSNPNSPSFSNKSGGVIKVEEWKATGEFFTSLSFSREILSVVHQPSYGTSNILMGYDGYLYVALNDYGTNSQDLSIFGRKLLRLDIDNKDAGKEYSIPNDNPYVDVASSLVKKEIWAHGFRNLWSLAEDPFNPADLWGADVGQLTKEEMNIIVKKGNHGWADGGDGESSSHGSGFNGKCANSGNANCEIYTDPEKTFFRNNSGIDMKCIGAGRFYRGDSASPLYGYHIFADVNTDNVVAMKKGEESQLLGNVRQYFTQNTDHNGIVYIAEDSYGQLYGVGLSWASATHEIYKIQHSDLIPNNVQYDPYKTVSENENSTNVRISKNHEKYFKSYVVLNSNRIDWQDRINEGYKFISPNGREMKVEELQSYKGLIFQYRK